MITKAQLRTIFEAQAANGELLLTELQLVQLINLSEENSETGHLTNFDAQDEKLYLDPNAQSVDPKDKPLAYPGEHYKNKKKKKKKRKSRNDSTESRRGYSPLLEPSANNSTEEEEKKEFLGNTFPFSELTFDQQEKFIDFWYNHLKFVIGQEYDYRLLDKEYVEKKTNDWKKRHNFIYLLLTQCINIAIVTDSSFAYFAFKVVYALLLKWHFLWALAILLAVVGDIYSTYVDLNLIVKNNVDQWVQGFYLLLKKHKQKWERAVALLSVASFLFASFTLCVFSTVPLHDLRTVIKNNVDGYNNVIDGGYYIFVFLCIFFSWYYYSAMSMLDSVLPIMNFVEYYKRNREHFFKKVFLQDRLARALVTAKLCFLSMLCAVNGAMSMYFIANYFPLIGLSSGILMRLAGLITVVEMIFISRLMPKRNEDEKYYPGTSHYLAFKKFLSEYSTFFPWKFQNLTKEQQGFVILRVVLQPLTLATCVFILFQQGVLRQMSFLARVLVSGLISCGVLALNFICEKKLILVEPADKCFSHCQALLERVHEISSAPSRAIQPLLPHENSEADQKPEEPPPSKFKQILWKTEATLFKPMPSIALRGAFRYALYYIFLISENTLLNLIPKLSKDDVMILAVTVPLVSTAVNSLYLLDKLDKNFKAKLDSREALMSQTPVLG